MKIIKFFDRYGEGVTKEAFGKSRSTVYLWKKKLKESRGDLRSLVSESRAPKKRRKRIINPLIKGFIIAYRREHPGVGQDAIKPALDRYCKEKGVKEISKSTIGRLISDLKKEGELKDGGVEVRINGRTGKMHIKSKKVKKKLRRKGYEPKEPGDLAQIDSITEFVDSLRRYVITGIDLKGRFAFAWGYKELTSTTARDFMKKFEQVCPFKIKRVQTDNGGEFEKFFRQYLDRNKVIQFFNYPHHPQSNGCVERFNRTVKEQFMKFNLDLMRDDIDEFNSRLMKYLLWYNTEKPHRGLGDLTPMDFYLDNFMRSSKKSNMYRDPTCY